MSISTIAAVSPKQRRLPLLPSAVAIYALGAAALSPDAYSGMILLYAGQMRVFSLLLVGLPLAALFLRPHAPTAFMIDLARRNALRFLTIFAGICVGLAAFTTYKLAIPNLVPFYADPFLADLDAWLHGGNPGEFVHVLLPSWAQYPLGWLYGPAWFLLWFGLMAFVAMHDSRDLRRRYFWSMSLTVCLLGTATAMLFSSVGPVLYEPIYHTDRFAALMAAVRDSAIGDYMQQASGYLLTNYQAGGYEMGTGISAMPSMHLAIVTLNAHMLGSLNRMAGALAWLYAALILVGSVFLGWHYAIDGYLSIAVVSVIWWAVGRMCSGAALHRAGSQSVEHMRSA
jgi:hypothetical protein